MSTRALHQAARWLTSFLLLACVHGDGSSCASGNPQQTQAASLLSAKFTQQRIETVNTEINESLTDLLHESLLRDVNATEAFPDAEQNSTEDPEDRHGLGALTKPFTFLYAKVAELETAMELQSMEIKALAAQLEEKSARVAGLEAAVALHAQQPDHKGDTEHLQKHVAKAKATERSARKKHMQKVSQLQKEEAHKMIRTVLGKHAHQHEHGFAKPMPSGSSQTRSEPNATKLKENREQSLQMRALQEGAGNARELDDSVSGKGFDFVSDAYNEAADKVSFVADTVIDNVEMAMAVLTQGFDFGASCPDVSWPSLHANDERVKINFGRQKCQATLVGQTITLFDFNFGEKLFKWPGPLATFAKLGSSIADCVKEGGVKDIMICFAKLIGNTMLEVLPPLSFLGQMQKMMEEFIVLFGRLASNLVKKALSESGVLIQEAVQTKFPEAGAEAVVKKFHKNFELRLIKRKVSKDSKASMLQKAQRTNLRDEDDDKPEGGLGFGAADYVPQEHKLITQFNGVETDSGSCLAFAPSVRGGPGNTVQPRDWQTPGRQSDNVPSEFIKLEPWAVPCANQWMKDNPNKWQGYSFYTWMTPLERCATVVYSLGLQPVLAFVGGLEFDLMPSPIAEVETFVCWPDTQPGGVDLSAIEMHIMSGGVPLLTRTIRLKKRFGSGTDFSNSNIHATTASGKANFGVPEDGADDSGLNGMSRDSLLQANASLGFEVEQENYLASMIYDDQLGANVTESLRGVAAARRLKALFPEKAEGLVETEEESNTEADDHVLFTLRSPGNGLVGFEIMGLLSDNKLQLSLQMQFGPFTTPRKRMTLIDLAQQLQIILGSIPFISVSSKAKAIQALHDFDTEAESSMPVSTDEGFGAFSTFWVIAGNGHREDQRGAMIYWTDSPRVYPFNHDVRATFRFFPDGEGEYWMVTSDSSDKPGKMVYLKDGGFHLHDFHEDPKTKWRMVEDGGQYWLVTGPNHHTPGKMMYLTDSGWSFWTFSPDPLCKFRLEPATGPTAFAIKPFMLNPAEVWIVTKEPHHGYENKMIFWKAGGTDVYNFNFAPESRWTLRSNGDGDYWLVTGSQSDSPGKMLYLKNNVFNVWNWNQDQKCLWRLVSSGGGGFWLATNPNHHTPNKMVYIANGVWNFVNFWEDPSTTYNVLLRG